MAGSSNRDRNELQEGRRGESELTQRQLGQLVPMVPVLIQWLRDADDNPGGLFLRETNPEGLDEALNSLFVTLQYEGDVSILQVRELGETYGPEVWVSGIRRIVTECEPPLVSYNVASTLFKSLMRLETAKTGTDCARILGPILDALNRANFHALAELCAILRDAKESSSQIACACGPLILLSLTGDGMNEQQQDAAAMAIMDLMIEECENIFGRAASKSEKFGLGARTESLKRLEEKRKKQGVSPGRRASRFFGSPMRAKGSSRSTSRDARSTDRKQKKKKPTQKKLSLDQDDDDDDDAAAPPPPPRESDLLRSERSRKGESRQASSSSPRNGTTPRKKGTGRDSPLPGTPNPRRPSYLPDATNDQALDQSRRQALRAFYLWRDPAKAERVDTLFDNYSFPDVAQSIHAKYGMLPPGWRQDLQDQVERGAEIDWLTGGDLASSSSSSPGMSSSLLRKLSISRNSNGPRQSVSMIQLETKLLEGAHNVVDEIVDSEQYFHDTLNSLLSTFAKTLRECATGRLGREKQQALGITADQVEALFGWRLEAVVETSTRLLEKLDVVGLVRATPKDPTGRPGLVAKAFIESEEDLGVYIPFVENHKSSLDIVRKAMKEQKAKQSLNPSVKKRGTMVSVHSTGASSGDRDEVVLRELSPMHFLEIWDIVSAQEPKLRGQSVQSLLITPVQRVPRYKLLLTELLKQIPEMHSSRDLVQRALNIVSETAGLIDNALATTKDFS